MDGPNHSGDPARSTAEVIYLRAQLLYPVVLLVAFIVSAGAHSILTARSEEELVVPLATGPGGKPLPVTKRKRGQPGDHRSQVDFPASSTARRFFQYATASVILTFFANATAIALRALQARGAQGKVGKWWCGEERTVSLSLPQRPTRRCWITMKIGRADCGDRSTLPARRSCTSTY